MPIANELALDSLLVRSPDQLSGDIDHEVVLLSLNRGVYYQLNEIGSRIWAHLASPMTVEALVGRLIEEFDVTRETCEAQALEFLRTLQAEGLIVRVTGEAPTRV
jgi:Coenzyme PQQ synthesis protein D (PqqD)